MKTALSLIEDLRPEPINHRRSAEKINPQSELTHDRYFQVWADRTTDHLTVKQLAEKYNYAPSHVKNILGWCSRQFEYLDKTDLKSSIRDQISHHLQKLETILEDDGYKLDGKEKAALLKEIRLSLTLLGRVDDVLAEGGNGGQSGKIEIVLPDIGRGQGIARPPVQEVLVNAETVN